MALVYKDRVKETTTTEGTGTYTLAGAATGFQAFSAIGDGNTCYYCATDDTDWEVGLGTYTASGTTLARTTILASSNSGSAVSWGAGSKDVFVVAPAQRMSQIKDGGTLTIYDSANDENAILSHDATTFNINVTNDFGNCFQVLCGSTYVFGCRSTDLRLKTGNSLVWSDNVSTTVLRAQITHDNTNHRLAFCINAFGIGYYGETLVLESDNKAFLGEGHATASPEAGTLNAARASGTDIAGAALNIGGSQGTGTGAGGALNIQYADAGTTGTSNNSLTTVISVSSAGIQIGEATTREVGFFGATPIAQPSSTGETTGFTAGSGTAVNDDSTFTGNVGSTAYRISDVVKHLKNLGLLAS